MAFWLRLLGTWIGFVCLWVLFVYSVSTSEIIAAGIAAALTVFSGFVIFRIIPACFKPRLRWIAQMYRLPAMVAQDLWLLFKCLVREIVRQPLPSTFVTARLLTESERCRAAAQRVLAILFVSTTPNSIVLDIDVERNQLFYHLAEPARAPELIRRLEN